jgi:hypothetical protein
MAVGPQDTFTAQAEDRHIHSGFSEPSFRDHRHPQWNGMPDSCRL